MGKVLGRELQCADECSGCTIDMTVLKAYARAEIYLV